MALVAKHPKGVGGKLMVIGSVINRLSQGGARGTKGTENVSRKVGCCMRLIWGKRKREFSKEEVEKGMGWGDPSMCVSPSPASSLAIPLIKLKPHPPSGPSTTA